MPHPLINAGGQLPAYKGEVPSEDVHENNAKTVDDVPASAPPVSDMDRVEGYENVNFEAGSVQCFFSTS